MHELSLAEGVLDVLRDAASKDGYARVTTVRLEIGRLSGVEVEAMRFCFDAVARGSIAEGARLEIDETPGSAWCLPCGRTVPIASRTDPCPACGSWQLQPNGGTRMSVREIEVE
ncbi:MAG: hydrogenase maturation nickel metallochaperone HypA [Burkholderiales bacterium]